MPSGNLAAGSGAFNITTYDAKYGVGLGAGSGRFTLAGSAAFSTSSPTFVLNPSDRDPNITIAAGWKTVTLTGTTGQNAYNIRSNFPIPVGRYVEVKFTALGTSVGSTPGIALANLSQTLIFYPGSPNAASWFQSGYAEWPNSGFMNNFGGFAVNDVLGILRRANSIDFYKNGTFVGSASRVPAGELYLMVSLANVGDSATANFGPEGIQYLPAGSAMTLAHPEKVGIGAFEGGDPYDLPGGGTTYTPANDAILFNAIKSIGFRWYHTWHERALAGDDGTVTRLPAWWWSFDSAGLAIVSANGQPFIGTNEPWNNVFGRTVDEVINDWWPQLQSLPNRLVAPSISSWDPGASDPWLADFMNKCALHGYRVDLLNVHFYTRTSDPVAATEEFRTYLVNLHNLYNKPIIVTEWGLNDFSAAGTSRSDYVNGVPQPHSFDQQIAFMQAAVQMLDGLDFVEKHSWYALTYDGSYDSNALILGDGSRTPLGDAFYDILHPSAVIPAAGAPTGMTLGSGKFRFGQGNGDFNQDDFTEEFMTGADRASMGVGMPLGRGTFNYTGHDATFRLGHGMALGSGTFVITGGTANLHATVSAIVQISGPPITLIGVVAGGAVQLFRPKYTAKDQPKNTTTRLSMPFAALLKRADPDFYRDRQFDPGYEFEGRDFKTNVSRTYNDDPNGNLIPV